MAAPNACRRSSSAASTFCCSPKPSASRYGSGAAGSSRNSVAPSRAAAFSVASRPRGVRKMYPSTIKKGSTTWTIGNDARFKTLDRNYTRGLADVLKLNTVMYHYNKGNAHNLPTEEQGYGFVAQELQQVYPEAVKQNEDGYLSVDFHPVLVSYINAIKS